MMVEAGAAFAAALVGGLAGSAHCVGMCGPFASWHGLRRGRALPRQMAYHGGRLATYLALAAAAGLAGEGLRELAAMVDLQRGLAVAMGGALVAIGVAWLLLPAGAPGPLGKGWARLSGKLLAVAGGSGGVTGPWLLGMSSTLLPCGLLYAFVLAAAATGSLGGSVATMMGFWLGTVPALAATGWLARRVGQGPLRHSRRVVGALLIVLGVVGVVQRWPGAEATEQPADCHEVGASTLAPRLKAGSPNRPDSP